MQRTAHLAQVYLQGLSIAVSHVRLRVSAQAYAALVYVGPTLVSPP
jgi:hypothetical protein